ncbi:uncharacterized protein I303_101758 [Kwoniella dejecticola CBS 10117]|uniref:Protein kinase domain-containing protein n=1 Tax=Kwoniella dejecticola CBS 10117 TaxID=1296121 RepID=A0AAJ8KK92_9TREE
MSFTLQCKPRLTQGRRYFKPGVVFHCHRHNRSTSTVTTVAESTPSLSQSIRASGLSTSIGTPQELSQREPLQPRQLSHRLSRIELGGNTSHRSTSIPSLFDNASRLNKILNPVSEGRSLLPPLSLSAFEADVIEPLGEEPDYPNIVDVACSVITVTKYIGPGYLWDFWLGDHFLYGQVVLKIVDHFDYYCMDKNTWEYIAPEDIIEEAVREEEFYQGPLRDLQGRTIPIFHGTYLSAGGGRFCATILEYAGRAIGPGVVLLSQDFRDKLYNAYKEIHMRGVAHGDTSSRHVLIDDQERIRIINFRRSAPIDLTDQHEVWQLMNEVVEIRLQIGMENKANCRHVDLPEWYYDKVDDREGFIKSIQPINPKDVVLPDWLVEHKQDLMRRGLYNGDTDSDEDLSNRTRSSWVSDEEEGEHRDLARVQEGNDAEGSHTQDNEENDQQNAEGNNNEGIEKEEKTVD